LSVLDICFEVFCSIIDSGIVMNSHYIYILLLLSSSV